MTQAASGIDLFIPEVYDIVWSLIILVIVAVFFYKFFMPKFSRLGRTPTRPRPSMRPS